MALALMLCLCLFAMPVLAVSASASLTGPGTVRAGDTITLTFHLNGSNVYGASGTLSYSSEHLELVGTKQQISGGWMVEFNGNNFVAYDNNLTNPINSSAALFTVTFKVKASVPAGTSIWASCTNLLASDEQTGVAVSNATYSAVIAAPRSGNNDLKSLTVSNATISPAFNTGITSYTAEVPYEVTKLNVTAAASDSNAKVSIYSPELTPNGVTNVTITVTAENGSTKTYVIAVKRAQDPNYVPSSNCDLAGIRVEGFQLSPLFSAGNTQYVIWLPYETENITVSGTPADGKASVRVEGGNALIAGADNEIKVICTAEDGTQKVYTVIAKRAAAHSGSNAPTDPPVDPSEPSDEPTVAPETQPPVSQNPVVTDHSNCISIFMLVIVALLCLTAGIVLGILLDKKYLQK